MNVLIGFNPFRLGTHYYALCCASTIEIVTFLEKPSFYVSGAQTFSCEGPPKLYVFGYGPPSQNI